MEGRGEGASLEYVGWERQGRLRLLSGANRQPGLVLVLVLGAHRERTTLTQVVHVGGPGGPMAAAGTESPPVCVRKVSLSSSREPPCSPPPPSPERGVCPTAGARLLGALSKAGAPKTQRPSEMTDTQEGRLCPVAGGDPPVSHEVRCEG